MAFKLSLILMAVAFSVESHAARTYWHFWCGRFIQIEGVSDIAEHFAQVEPNYFTSARYEFPDGHLVGPASLHKSLGPGSPGLTFFSTADTRNKTHYAIAEREEAPFAPLGYGITDRGLPQFEGRHAIAAWFRGGAVLLSDDFRWLALCRYPLDEDFVKFASFAARVPGGLNEKIEYLRSCESRLSGRLH